MITKKFIYESTNLIADQLNLQREMIEKMNFLISQLFLVLKIEKSFKNRYQMRPLFNLFSLVDDHDAMLPIEMIIRPLLSGKTKRIKAVFFFFFFFNLKFNENFKIASTSRG
jgi:hypothetical protein